MDAILDYAVARLQEPSTWVSLGTMLTGLGVVIAPEYWQAIMGVGMSAGGLAGVVLRERKKTTPAEIKKVVEQTVEPEVLKEAPAVVS
jgi:hypothetical protein